MSKPSIIRGAESAMALVICTALVSSVACSINNANVFPALIFAFANFAIMVASAINNYLDDEPLIWRVIITAFSNVLIFVIVCRASVVLVNANVMWALILSVISTCFLMFDSEQFNS